MPIGTSDGEFYKNELEFAKGRARVYINTNVEDRRDEDYTNTFKSDGTFNWEGIPKAMKDVAVSTGNALWGTPMDPEAPVTDLSRSLGHEDVRTEPNVGRSLLQRGIDDIQNTANIFGIGRGESWADKLVESSSRMPPGASTEPADALFSPGGSQTPGNTSNELIRPEPYGLNPPERETPFPRPRASGIISGLVKGVAEGIELFGGKQPTWAMDPTTGEVRTDPITIEKVMHAAELATFGPGVIAGKAAEGTLGSFIGAKAKTWDKNNYALANIMERQGKTSDEILQKTGMHRGVDKKWKSEISDTEAYIDPDWASSMATKPTRHQLEEAVRDMARKEYAARGDRFATKEEMQAYMDDPLAMYEVFDKKDFEKYFPGWKFDRNLEMTRTGKTAAKLGDVYEHPELYKAYPELKNLPLIEDPAYAGVAEAGIKGEYIKYNRQNLENAGHDLKSVVIHEIQHVLQQIEGFAKGGGPVDVARGLYRLKYQLDDAQLKQANDIVKSLVEKFKEKGLEEAEFQALQRLEKIISTHAKYIKAADVQAHENYMRLAGEVEARNAASRQDIPTEDLRRYNPLDSQDTYSINQIVETEVPPGMTAYGILLRDGSSRPVPSPIPPAMTDDISNLRVRANDNLTPDEQAKLRKAARKAESDKNYAEFKEFKDQLEDKIATRELAHHLESPERARFRLGQLLRDKASSKKAGVDVDGIEYMKYNYQIRKLREYLKNQ